MQADESCPLCGRTGVMHKARKLYGTDVCKKCYYGLINRRQLAYVIDAIAWSFVTFPIGLGLGLIEAASNIDPAVFQAMLIVLFWLVLPFIFCMKDGFNGTSPGKALCGVFVADRDTFEPIGEVQSLKRNLILIVPFMPLVIAFTLYKGLRPGDGWANTKVIWTKYRNHPVFTGQLACERCQYNLTGNVSGMCPECGTVISQQNRRRLAEHAATAV